MLRAIIFLLIPLQLFSQSFSQNEIKRWETEAKQVTIIRDNWGIPHIYGKTDAHAVFGLMYAQCEDDFKRIEMNYIEKLGRMSEIKGEGELKNDLYIRLIIDSAEAVADYKNSPVWLTKLLNAYADGINYFLYKNPSIQPLLLKRFQPWYPLLWTDGSIGAISTGDVTEEDVKKFYLPDQPLSIGNATPGFKENSIGSTGLALTPSHTFEENSSGSTDLNLATSRGFEENSSGSNGFAIAPSRSASGKSLLYINPHVTFYFRPEVQVTSEEGLQVYGAITWGQFFVYQGFNQYCGWMHTSSNVDVADLYAEKIIRKNGKLFYEYNKSVKPLTQKQIVLRYKNADGLQSKSITAFYTGHGPVMANRDGQWISVKSYNRALKSLIQSWKRTKAKDLDDFKQIMRLYANTSNNTVFADYKGNIAYWHGDFVPRRDPKLNWSKPVDGTILATEWKGLHKLEEIVHVYNPPNGWLQNCNSTPFTAAGDRSPHRDSFPSYMAPDGENFRGVNAVRVLNQEKKFTIDKLIAAGYDTKLSAFELLIPALVSVFEKNVSASDSLYLQLAEPIAVLKSWDYYAGPASVATTLAIEWAQKLTSTLQRVYIDEGWDDQVKLTKQFASTATKEELLPPLLAVINELKSKFGDWKVAWGEINRYQRVSSDIDQKYDDSQPSYPVGFASSAWGMLPAYNSRYYPGTKKRYGVSGNSFICAVEFGPRIKAKSLLAGGESGHPHSKHFNDQLEMYSKGQFKEVLFYKEDVMKHAERTYHPGAEANPDK